MPTRPTDTPSWATDANYPAGTDPWSGTPTRVEPSAPQKGTGNVPATRPPAQHHNWLQGLLADWIGYFAAIVDADEEHTYQTPKSRQIVIPFRPYEFNTGGAQIWIANSTAMGVSGLLTTSAGVEQIARYLPHGAVLTAVEVLVHPEAARVGTARMLVQVLKTTIDWSTPSIPADTQVGSDTYDDGTTNLQVIPITGLNETVSSAEDIRVRVRVGTSTAGDDVYAIRLTFDDPGPRNH